MGVSGSVRDIVGARSESRLPDKRGRHKDAGQGPLVPRQEQGDKVAYAGNHGDRQEPLVKLLASVETGHTEKQHHERPESCQSR